MAAGSPGAFPQLDPESTVNQFREFLSSYNKLSEQCFQDCVSDFTTRKILDGENSCSMNCLEKYLKMTQRISQRFQEYQMTHAESNPTLTNMTATGK